MIKISKHARSIAEHIQKLLKPIKDAYDIAGDGKSHLYLVSYYDTRKYASVVVRTLDMAVSNLIMIAKAYEEEYLHELVDLFLLYDTVRESAYRIFGRNEGVDRALEIIHDVFDQYIYAGDVNVDMSDIYVEITTLSLVDFLKKYGVVPLAGVSAYYIYYNYLKADES